MGILNINDNWKFTDFKENIEAIKTQYEGILSSFLCIQLQQKGEVLHKIHQEIFENKKLLYWQRERTWEVINGDLEIEKYKRLGGNNGRVKK